MPEERNDLGLIKKLAGGDAFAFDEIFGQYHKRVFFFALSNLKNKEDAEEVVQEVFLSLWKSRTSLKELKSLDAWIFSVSFNIIRKHFRELASDKKHLEKYSETASTDDTSTTGDIEYNDLLVNTEAIIEQLPSRQKTVFLLSKKEGLSNTEISSKLNISKKTVENHLSLVKALLKKALLNRNL